MVLHQLPLMLSPGLLSCVVSLVHVYSIEVAIGQDINMDRELLANGASNAVIGLFSGMIAYHHISDTSLAYRLNARSRLVGITTTLICTLPFLVGSDWLGFSPIPLLAGILLYLGFGFL